jgi:hypothetical protein
MRALYILIMLIILACFVVFFIYVMPVLFPPLQLKPLAAAEIVTVPTSPVRAVHPCSSYALSVRTAHFHYFGLDYPYWYGLGQLQQESSCREKAKSFDGGKGLAQFMPRTWEEIAGQIEVTDPYNPVHAIKAQAYYMSRLHRLNWDGALWLTYCFYNSGPGTMKKEYRRAGITDYTLMRSLCSRRVISLKNGGTLDLCEVGYDYPVKVEKYGSLYKRGIDRIYFW